MTILPYWDDWDDDYDDGNGIFESQSQPVVGSCWKAQFALQPLQLSHFHHRDDDSDDDDDDDDADDNLQKATAQLVATHLLR